MSRLCLSVCAGQLARMCMLQCVAVCCRVLQCVAVRCSELQCVASACLAGSGIREDVSICLFCLSGECYVCM